MAIKLPSTTLYTVQEASKRYNVPEGVLYQEIKKGTLEAVMRRGVTRGYLITDEIMDDWLISGLTPVSEVTNA